MHWKIDHALIEQACGEAGGTAMKALFLETVLPSEDVRISLEESKLAASEFMRSGRFAWAAEATRTEITTAAALIDGLVAGHPLEQNMAKTAWMQRVHTQIGFYISWVPPQGDSPAAAAAEAEQDLYESDVGTLYGAAALQKKYEEEIKKVTPQEKLRLDDYKLFGTFRHLLTQSMASDLDARISKLCSAEAPKASKRPKQSKPAIVKSDKACSQALSLANDLLGL